MGVGLGNQMKERGLVRDLEITRCFGPCFCLLERSPEIHSDAAEMPCKAIQESRGAVGQGSSC